MLRSVVGKVMWVGRATVSLVGLAVILALVLGMASTALGANGQPFILGQKNAATAFTRLTGNVNGSALQIINNNADADDTALSLNVQSGEAPMRVNSSKKVTNLNADKLDGNEANAFLGVNDKAADADKLDGKDSSVFLRDAFRKRGESFSSSTPSGSRVCVTSAYTPASPQTALIDINTSIIAPAASSVTDVFLRGSVSSDGGISWTSTDQASPEIDVGAGTKAALGYADAYPLEPGESYNFASQVNYSGTSGSSGGICQVLVTFINR